LPPIGGVNFNFDADIEFSSGLSNGAHFRIIFYVYSAMCGYLMMKKELRPEYLRWHLQVQEFDFEVCDKGKLGVVKEPINKPAVHTLIDSESLQK